MVSNDFDYLPLNLHHLMRTTLFLSIVFGSALLALNQRPTSDKASVDPEKGKRYYQTCIACHGEAAGGNELTSAPRLASLQDWYLRRQLNNFRSGRRGKHPEDLFGAQMSVVSSVLIDSSSVRDVVEYIATLEPPVIKSEVSLGDLDKGKQLFQRCAACHGENGQGIDSLSAPRLAGQYEWYIRRQLLNFQKRIRPSDRSDSFGLQMGQEASVLRSENDIDAVVHYISSLSGEE